MLALQNYTNELNYIVLHTATDAVFFRGGIWNFDTHKTGPPPPPLYIFAESLCRGAVLGKVYWENVSLTEEQKCIQNVILLLLKLHINI